MAENIFEGAKFGDKFRTRDGRMAIYMEQNLYDDHILIIQDSKGYHYEISKGNSGRYYDETPTDIISEWQEEISEEELDKLADEYAEEAPMSGVGYYGDTEYWTWDDVVNAYKAGYRKAKGL